MAFFDFFKKKEEPEKRTTGPLIIRDGVSIMDKGKWIGPKSTEQPRTKTLTAKQILGIEPTGEVLEQSQQNFKQKTGNLLRENPVGDYFMTGLFGDVNAKATRESGTPGKRNFTQKLNEEGALGFFYEDLLEDNVDKQSRIYNSLLKNGIDPNRAEIVSRQQLTTNPIQKNELRKSLTEEEQKIISRSNLGKNIFKGLDALDFIPLAGTLAKFGIKEGSKLVKSLVDADNVVDVAGELKKYNLSLDDEIIRKIATEKDPKKVTSLLDNTLKEAENLKILDDVKYAQKEQINILNKFKNPFVDKTSKALGFQASAIKRGLTGKPTTIEFNKELLRLNSNFVGKKVTLNNGNKAIVQGTSYGKIKVITEGGDIKNVLPEDIVKTNVSSADVLSSLRKSAKEQAKTFVSTAPKKKVIKKSEVKKSETLPKPKKTTKEIESLQKVYDQTVETPISKVGRLREIRAYRKANNLTQSDIKKIAAGRDYNQLTESQYKKFLDDIVNKGVEVKKRRTARNILKYNIEAKELKKVDNLRKSLKLPGISKMDSKQLGKLNSFIEKTKTGDTFLTTRQLETINKTELNGSYTLREVREKLAKKIGVNPEDLDNLKISGKDKIHYDIALARKNPFYGYMVKETHQQLLKAETNFLKQRNLIRDLIKYARKSRKTTLANRLVPTDKQIFRWLEADDAGKATLAKNMTQEELKAAETLQSIFLDIRNKLVEMDTLKQFKTDYITHIRRGFLEGWKEDGFIKAIKEVFENNKLDEASFAVKNPSTGEVLSLEKFFKFAMRRTDKISPTMNVADASLAYIRTFERKKVLDEIVPLFDTYASSLTPNNLSATGLINDNKLRIFVKQWLNTKKGNVVKFAVEPGGKADWLIRSGVAVTRLLDLAFSVPIGAASFVGESVMNITSLGFKKSALGTKRSITQQGKNIIKANETFIGESFFKRLTDPALNIGDKFLETSFGLFSASARRANIQYLLGSLSRQEFATGVISQKRLNEIKLEMGRWRVTPEAESIIGKAAEGKAFTQYKSWAVPILETSIDNLRTIKKGLQTDGIKSLKSREAQEMLRATLLTTVLGVTVTNYANSLENKKDKNFFESVISKAGREATTFLQGVNPFLWLSLPRLVSFVTGLTSLLEMIVKLERTENGELKAPGRAKTLLIPSVARQLLPKTSQKTKAEVYWDDVKSKVKTKSGRELTLANLKKDNSSLYYSVIQMLKDEENNVTDDEKTIRNLGVENEEQANYYYNKIQSLKYATERKEYIKDLEARGIITSDTVKKQLIQLLNGDIKPNQEYKKQSIFEKVLKYGNASFVDPANTLKAAFSGEEIGKVEGNLVELKRDKGEKYGVENTASGFFTKIMMMEEAGIDAKDVGKWGREHILPVKSGGSSSLDNQILVPIAEHLSYTELDKAVNNAVQDKTMSKKEAERLMKKVKVDKSISVEEALKRLKNE